MIYLFVTPGYFGAAAGLCRREVYCYRRYLHLLAGFDRSPAPLGRAGRAIRRAGAPRVHGCAAPPRATAAGRPGSGRLFPGGCRLGWVAGLFDSPPVRRFCSPGSLRIGNSSEDGLGEEKRV